MSIGLQRNMMRVVNWECWENVQKHTLLILTLLFMCIWILILYFLYIIQVIHFLIMFVFYLKWNMSYFACHMQLYYVITLLLKFLPSHRVNYYFMSQVCYLMYEAGDLRAVGFSLICSLSVFQIQPIHTSAFTISVYSHYTVCVRCQRWCGFHTVLRSVPERQGCQ